MDEIKINEEAMIISPVNSGNLMEQEENDGHFYSIVGKTMQEKKMIYNALNNPADDVAKHINELIEVKDLLIEMVELTDDFGEITRAPRIILINPDGISYACVSLGIFNSIKKLANLFGMPTWEEPLSVKVKQIPVKKGSMLTLELV